MALALYAVVKADQMVHFEAEYKALSSGKSINPKSSIAPLYPFMDNGVIRVGGRLAHGYSMTDDQWFPLLVSHRSKLATLAINDAHKQTLHGGPTVTAAEMRRQVWVTQAMKKVSACIKKCVTCFRFNSGSTQQLMGDLPSSRIEAPERAFSCVGLDFAGPLTLCSDLDSFLTGGMKGGGEGGGLVCEENKKASKYFEFFNWSQPHTQLQYPKSTQSLYT